MSVESKSLAAEARTSSSIAAFVEALRPQQWIKNAFVCAPAIFAGELFDTAVMARVAAAVALFCASSSATYLLNDLLDRQSDRKHPIKRQRAVASGRLSTRLAAGAALVIAAAAMVLAMMLSGAFAIALAGYVAVTVLYSTLLKHAVILDVMALAAGFVLRVAAGAVVAGVEASEWLFLCTLLIALFLGFSKRRHELTLLEGEAASHRRVLVHYSPELLDQMLVIVATAAVICYILYTIWPDTVAKFGTNHLIYTVPFVIYGIFRYFYLIHRHDVGGDPTDSLLTDRPLLVAVLFWGVVAVSVIYFRI
jgi:4-hydroxybenzoate polyprenyltransferase